MSKESQTEWPRTGISSGWKKKGFSLPALLGGVLSRLMALPLPGISTGTANFSTYNDILFHFRITPTILLQGMVFAAFVGILGGGLPARRATRRN